MEPVERLDILDGRVRIRKLPEAEGEAMDSYKVMVVDDSAAPNGERGVVKWVDAGSLTTGADCDWVVQDVNGYSPHISTAYDGSSCEWSRKEGVGIGVVVPKMKLMVFHTDREILEPTAIWGSSRFDAVLGEEVYGVVGEARPPIQQTAGMQAFGVLGDAFGSKYSTGVRGHGRMDQFIQGSAARLTGVSGAAEAFNNAEVCIGVYGKANGCSDSNWGGYFEGRGFLGASAWTYSDAGLKTGIEDLEPSSGMEAIMALRPKRYYFDTEAYPYLTLPEEMQYGLIAQEVEEVLPSLVLATKRPEQLDSTGAVVEEALDFKAMNYLGLVPVLIAAMQEQQLEMESMRQDIASMEEALASCCARNFPGSGTMEEPSDEKGVRDARGERLLRIDPNPFNEQTTIRYTLERGGRAMLLLNSSDGKQLQVLHEGAMDKGEYSRVWNTTHLAPGMYYLTLLLDGEPLVKRAVKL